MEEQRVELAAQLEEIVKSIQQSSGRDIFELGKALKEIRDNELYKELGYDTVTDWYKSPEIGMSPSWAASFISMYELYIVKLGKKVEDILPSDYSKLRDIAPIIESKPEEADEWIDKAKHLRRVDLKREVREFEFRHSPATTREVKQEDVKSSLTTFDKIEQESIDCIISSIPLFVTKNATTSLLGTDNYQRLTDSDSVYSKYDDIVFKCLQVLKENGQLFFIAEPSAAYYLGALLQQREATIVASIVWQNPDAPAKQIDHLVHVHKLIIWARKGKKHTTNIVDYEPDVWKLKTFEDVFRKIVVLGTNPGDTILDGFVQKTKVYEWVEKVKRSIIYTPGVCE